MNPELSGFALGLLFGAAKVGAVAAIGFGIAWWRARLRIRQLEADQLVPPWSEERIARLEQGFEAVAEQLDRLVRVNTELNERLAGGRDKDLRLLPPQGDPVITPPAR